MQPSAPPTIIPNASLLWRNTDPSKPCHCSSFGNPKWWYKGRMENQKTLRDVAAEILQGNVACCSRNADCQQCIHHPKASSLLLLLQIFQSSQSSHSVPTCSGKLSSSGKLFLVFDSSPGSFKTKPICSVKAPASPARCSCPSSRLEFPAPAPAQQNPRSSVQMEMLPALLVTNSFTLEEWGACPHLKDYLDSGTMWIECRMGIPKYLWAKKLQVIKAVDGRVFKVSVFLHPHMSEPDTALQNGKQTNFP